MKTKNITCSQLNVLTPTENVLHIFMWGLCHALDGYMPTSHNKGPSLILGQSVWNLRWTKWHWKRYPPSTSVFPC